jgi:hypothetical protein
MPKIIKLGELLPEDFVIDLNGQKFTLPGDGHRSSLIIELPGGEQLASR